MDVKELLERDQAVTKSKLVRSSMLSREDIAALYMLLTKLSKESMKRQAEIITEQIPPKSVQDIEIINNVRNSFRVHVKIQDTKLGTIYASDSNVFSKENFPKEILSVFFSTKTEYKNLANGKDPIQSIEVFLDFERPLAVDFVNLPSHPTKNGSAYDVNGNDPTWVNGAYQRLETFFEEKSRKIEWLHRQGTYDLALWVIGIPIIFWAIYRVSNFIGMSFWQDFFRIGVYVFEFFLFANLAKFVFTYARWVFPLFEYTDSMHPAKHHKTFLLGMLIAIFGTAIYDGISLVFQ